MPRLDGDAPVARLHTERVSYPFSPVLDEVAAVAAHTPYQASDALKAIKVDYEKLPFILDRESALKSDAPKLHEAGNTGGDARVTRRGDVAKGFAEADVVLEETFYTSVQIHVPMETHGSVVKWDGDKVTIWDSTQGVYDAVLLPFARTMGIPTISTPKLKNLSFASGVLRNRTIS
jgi:xanthine dehydrogenase YagR molybdenum-binding subunit